jgi:DNA-binding MltR family transcriptional regulator
MKPDFKERFILSLKPLFDESDRGLVIVAVSLIDDSLARLLQSKMPGKSEELHPIFDAVRNGSLSSIHAKCQLAAAFGWCEEDIVHDIRVLAKMRNVFAHSIEELDFLDRNVQASIKKLRYVKEFRGENDLHQLDEVGIESMTIASDIGDIRDPSKVSFTISDVVQAKLIFVDTIFYLLNVINSEIETD